MKHSVFTLRTMLSASLATRLHSTGHCLHSDNHQVSPAFCLPVAPLTGHCECPRSRLLPQKRPRLIFLPCSQQKYVQVSAGQQVRASPLLRIPRGLLPSAAPQPFQTETVWFLTGSSLFYPPFFY